ncbi:MAG: hypothetical protein AAGA39_05845, partial [Pseudomonadota bacterium]
GLVTFRQPQSETLERMKKPILSAGIKIFLTLGAWLTLTAATDLQLSGADMGYSSRLGRKPAVVPEAAAPIEAPAAQANSAPPRAPMPVPGAAVHLASYYDWPDAEQGWDILLEDHRSLLAGQQPILREVDLGARGRFVRLLAGPLPSVSDAQALCHQLEQEGAYCAPADPAGDLLPSHQEWN